MFPIIRIIKKNIGISGGEKFAVQYLKVTKRFVLPDKKEWKPYISYSGLPDDLFWFTSLASLEKEIIQKIKFELI
jgi:hypothetical protein